MNKYPSRIRMKPVSALTFSFLAASALLAPAGHAADFAAPGAKATLTVELVYESAGSRKNVGMMDTIDWRAARSATIVANVSAQAVTSLPTLAAPDAKQVVAQNAYNKNALDKSKSAASKMAPMMDSIEKIMAKCGDDEACISRATANLGFGMSDSQMAANMSAGKDIAGVGKPPGEPAYQSWRMTSAKGKFSFNETAHITTTDPICVSRPKHRCTRDETRKGDADLPMLDKNGTPITEAAYELDMNKKTVTVRVPIPLLPLPIIENIITDEPEGTHDVPTPKGPHKITKMFIGGDGGMKGTLDFTLPLQGDWRNQSGEQVVTIKGALAEGGKLKIRWTFK